MTGERYRGWLRIPRAIFSVLNGNIKFGKDEGPGEKLLSRDLPVSRRFGSSSVFFPTTNEISFHAFAFSWRGFVNARSFASFSYEGLIKLVCISTRRNFQCLFRAPFLLPDRFYAGGPGIRVFLKPVNINSPGARAITAIIL